MPGGFYTLAVGILCTWRVTHLFVVEDGPWKIFATLRRRMGLGFWATLLGCFYCFSLWVAVPFAFLLSSGWVDSVCSVLAFSAGAILLERAARHETAEAAAPYFEHPEGGQDAVLRTGPITTDGTHSQSQD